MKRKISFICIVFSMVFMGLLSNNECYGKEIVQQKKII